jgi:hypothetical protein
MNTYPLTLPDGDPRFTGNLIDDVAAVLVAHGFPPLFEDDTVFAGLRTALTGFLYGPAFNTGNKVTWFQDNKVWNGHVEFVTNTDDGPVARIATSPQPGGKYRTTEVIACRHLTLVPGGAR